MSGRTLLAGIGTAALLLGGTTLAQIDVQQLEPGGAEEGQVLTEQIGKPDGRAAQDAQQIAPTESGDKGWVESITPKDSAGVQIEQPQGRDFCDPSVSQSERRAAGVKCNGEVPVNGQPERPGLAQDPLLTPKREDLKEDFENLNLGDDVPATVILQQ